LAVAILINVCSRLVELEREQQSEEKQPISAYEAAQEFAGCVDFDPSDLATNKEYLKGMGKK